MPYCNMGHECHACKNTQDIENVKEELTTLADYMREIEKRIEELEEMQRKTNA